MMNLYNFQGARSIVVSGDIHGDFKELVHKCCVRYGLRDTLVVVAGDCGFGFERPGYYENVYKGCGKHLVELNDWIVFVRGNHDNPAYFDGLQVSHRRWTAVPDYSVLSACGHAVLCVGGAVSVDREARRLHTRFVLKPKDRLESNVYWPDEHPVFDQQALDVMSRSCRIDTVVTHTAPSFCELTSHAGIEYYTQYNEMLLDDVKAERRTMDRLHDYLTAHGHPLSQWFYGHFHQSWHSRIGGVRYNMLDCMEFREVY